MPSKPVPAELATVVHKLQSIARRHNVDYALLAVRGDGRAEIETHHASRGFRSLVPLGLDEDDNVIEWGGFCPICLARLGRVDDVDEDHCDECLVDWT